ncbi:dual OB domain-containing protein [Candidatus Entotheonella palauensis]|uniref:dual OB domain-containing protein n=1 Tax=Candidatus Entotheonella palauensis TaxID=93172 RepID=UPI000B7F58F1|nr:hypothetical protein [Candidatus Entotheonella palauensis]
MNETKKIVCLANSRKNSERCIAGREVIGTGFARWIRPVSAPSNRAISQRQQRYKNDKDVSVLDIVEIKMRCSQPNGYHQENYLIDDVPWVKTGILSWQELQSAVEDPGGPLWINDYSSSNGQNDRIPEVCLSGLNRSLYLLRPDRLKVIKVPRRGYSGSTQPQVRACFHICGQSYSIAVTDPWMEHQMRLNSNGHMTYEDVLLCISLGEVFEDGFAYKLAAGVITPQRAGG